MIKMYIHVCRDIIRFAMTRIRFDSIFWDNKLRIESTCPFKVLKVGRLYVELLKIYDTGDTPIDKSLLTRVPGTIVPRHIYNNKKCKLRSFAGELTFMIRLKIDTVFRLTRSDILCTFIDNRNSVL